MKKIIQNKLITSIAISLILLLSIIIYTYQYVLYEKPQNINKIYSGMKFSIADTAISEKVDIKIVGLYTKLHNSQARFKGTISFQDLIVNYDDEFTSVQGKNVNIASINMGVKQNFTLNKEAMLDIYFNKELTKMCIALGDKKGTTGVFISAPCSIREEAINILDTFFK